MPKLSSACFALRVVAGILSRESVITVYFAYLHSILKYGIIFWGNSPNSKKVFLIQKRALRIMFGKKPTDSCRPLFKSARVLPLACEYIYASIMFISKNQHLFHKNESAHDHNTRKKTLYIYLLLI